MTQKKSADAPATIIAYKGFHAQMQCRGYQFKVGETFEHDGPVAACESGFHSCENPLDVFEYYEPGTSLFAEVEASGQLARHGSDSKVACARLHVRAMLSVPDLIGRAIAWVTAHCNPATSSHTKEARSASSATGACSASSATGYSSASSATGDSSASVATGWCSRSEIKPAEGGKPLHAVAIATGHQSRARAPAGSALVLVERNDEGEILHIRASRVGENGIQPDTWYTLLGGEFVTVTDEE
ncbi:MAG: DUF7666 domain-containing protein [Steroidobacteraceae bacterium]